MKTGSHEPPKPFATPLRSVGLAVCVALLFALSPSPVQSQILDADAIEIASGSVVINPTGWRAEGSVVLSLGPWHIDAESALLEGDMLALTKARLQRGGQALEAGELTIDLMTGAISGRAFVLTGESGSLRIAGESMAWNGDALVAEGAELWPREGMSVRGQRLTLSAPAVGWWKGERIALSAAVESEGGALRFSDTTVGWLAEDSRPLDGRQAGILPPELGVLGEVGVIAGVVAFVPLGNAVDLTPRVWASSGLDIGGSLGFRFAQRDGLGRAPVGVFKIDGLAEGGERPGGAISGRGALDGGGLPPLRFDLAALSSRETVDLLRRPVAERLGGTARSAASLRPRGSGSELDVGVVLWQPLGSPGSLWRGPALSEAVTAVSYGLRDSPFAPVLVDLDLDLSRRSPLGANTSGVTEVGLSTAVRSPFALGRFAKLEVGGALGHRATIFEVPLESPEPPETARSVVRQVLTGTVEARLSSLLMGRDGGRTTRVRPELWVAAAPVRPEFGDKTTPSPIAALDGAELAAFGGGLWQTRWSGGSLRLESGVLALDGFRGRDTSLARLGWRAVARFGSVWGLASVDGEVLSDPGLRETRGEIGMGAGRWRLSLGGLSLEEGPRLNAPSWRAPALMPSVIAEVDGPLRGAVASLRAPLWPLEGVDLSVRTLVPVEGLGVRPGDLEIVGGVEVGCGPGCARIGLEIARRTAPEVFDVMLTARVAGF